VNEGQSRPAQLRLDGTQSTQTIRLWVDVALCQNRDIAAIQNATVAVLGAATQQAVLRLWVAKGCVGVLGDHPWPSERWFEEAWGGGSRNAYGPRQGIGNGRDPWVLTDEGRELGCERDLPTRRLWAVGMARPPQCGLRRWVCGGLVGTRVISLRLGRGQ